MAERATRQTGNTPIPMLYQPIPIAAAVNVENGHMVCVDTNGRACPVDPANNDKRVIGVLRWHASYDNSAGSAGDLNVDGIRAGCFEFTNSASADEITRADIGKTCYAVNGYTVAKTSTQAGVLGARPAAGRVFDITESGKVLVIVNPTANPQEVDEDDLFTSHFITMKSAGTWTLTESSDVILDTLTAANATIFFLTDLTNEAKAQSSKGRALKSVTMLYGLGTAALDALDLSLKQVVVPAHGTAVTATELAGGTTDDDYDEDHDTAAKRVLHTEPDHTLTVTVPDPAVLADNRMLLAVAHINGSATGEFIFKGFLARWARIR